MRIELARQLAGEVIEMLKPACGKVELVGSVSKGKANPKDIDLLLNVKDRQLFLRITGGVQQPSLFPEWLMRYKGEIVDLFIDEG